MAFLVREYFKEPSQVLKKWLEDDQSMTYFHSQMKAMLNEYYQIKKSVIPLFPFYTPAA